MGPAHGGKSLTEIMMRKIQGMSKEQLSKVPRDIDGNIVLDERICEDGMMGVPTKVSACTD
jgi:hypothetical protein